MTRKVKHVRVQVRHDQVLRRRAAHETALAKKAMHAADWRLVAARRAPDLACGWCGTAIDVKARGRIPKWCSHACRQRAWEQARAAASGCCDVEVVERLIQMPGSPRPAPRIAEAPRHDAWNPLLRDLAHQLDTGALYRRDLPALVDSLNIVLVAYRRRAATSTHRSTRA